ncbi:MAG: hypothetical protein HY342_13125 [Candidatus Lambdaproteobacteria bacterium]|nr:hypothetical protein [Candidatus Lambdaproteobacteria bacterium]
MSVGHVARIFEEAGLPTVIVMVRAFLPRVAAMKPPRVVVTRHIMGRPMGAPHDAERQRQVLHAALDLLVSARQNGSILELPEPYRAAT